MKIPSLRVKLMLLFLGFFFVPYLLLTFFSISMSRGMMKESTIAHLQNLVEVKETAIEQWFRERVSDGKAIVESREVKSLDPARIASFLSHVGTFERAYLELWILNAKGEIVSGSLCGRSFSGEPWFEEAFREGLFLSRPQFQPPYPHPVVTLSMAILDGEGRPVGVLRELVDLTYISDLISEALLGKTGEFFVVSPEGEFVLHHSLPELRQKGITKVPYFEKAAFRAAYTGVYRDYTGNEVLGSWKWLRSLRCTLIAEQDTKEAFYDIDLLARKAILILVASTLVILGISYWVIGRATNPIKRLSETVASIAEGRFEETATTKRTDEIGRLVAGFNAMTGRLRKAYAELEGKVEVSNKELETAYLMLKQRQEQLVQSEKMAALGQLSAGIAHEIRNPLTSIKLFIQSLEKEIDLNRNQKEDFRIIKKEIDRINGHITQFLNFARPEEPSLQAVRVGTLVEETVTLLGAKLKKSGIRLEIAVPADHPAVEGDPNQLAQVLLNLLLNAVEAMPQGGTLSIRSVLMVDPDSREDCLQLIVEDTGEGISEEDRSRLFDPFFTTKSGGTGLGLSIAYSIVQKHNGRIDVESTLGRGSTFILSLPVQKEAPCRPSSS